MKLIIKIYSSLLMIFFMGTLFLACEEDTVKATLKANIEENELEALSSNDYVLTFDERNDVFDELVWTKPDFGFSASVSYTVEIDLSGNNFTDAIEVLTTREQSVAPTQGMLNTALLNLGLTAGEATSVSIRIRCDVNPNVDPVYSTVQTFTVTPFATIFPPLYIIGDAQSWDLNNALELKNIGPSQYEVIGSFVNNGKFRFFVSPSWDAVQYRYSSFSGGSIATELADGADGDSNFLFTGTSGVYKLTVSLANKVITVESADTPTLYVIGGDQGWNLSNAFELTWLGGGRYEGTTTFSNDNTFRMFTQPDWSAGTINYPYFKTVDDRLENANDADSNFRFISTTGTYTIKVDLYNLTVDMTP